MQQPAFSIIVPAYNEEQYLPRTLGALRKAEEALGEPVEIVVADNLSTDKTQEVAREFNAKVIEVKIKCISAVRNRAAAAASGKYLLFVDADNQVSEDLLVEIKPVMDSGAFIGGGLVHARYDRKSLGLSVTHGLIRISVAMSGVSMFLFYTTPEAFAAMGGFNEELLATEDMDFAHRLKKLGKSRGLKYKNLRTAHLVLSSRKFDEYGDWSLFLHPIQFLRACLGDRRVIHEIWYKERR